MAKIADHQRPAISELGGNAADAPASGNRKIFDHFAPLADTFPVKFIELHSSMCRWPIGDPQNFETFRFCGSFCATDESYCKAHTAIAHAASRPLKPRVIRTY
jgi:hypothetical protein